MTVDALVALANTGGGTDKLAVDTIDTDKKVGLIKIVLGAYNANDGYVSASTPLPVSLASVPSHAVTNAGTFAVQESGAALTSLQLIDDIVFAEDVAHVSGDKGVMALAVRNPAGTTLTSADGDYSGIAVDGAGRPIVVGITSPGNAANTNPHLIGLSDGTNVQYVRGDTSGRPIVVGAAASGAALAGSPVRVGASDGTNAVDLRAGTSTTNGGAGIVALVVRPFVATDGTNVAPTMDAAARKGWVAVTDGTNTLPTGDAHARAIYVRFSDGTNAYGQVVGAGASGAAVAGNPVRIGGSDGTNTRDISTDTSGRQIVVGAAASAAALAGNPVRVGASDGTNAVDLRAGTSTTNGGTSIVALVVRPFVATDGTNVAPTMDAAARKGWVAVTDGTNTQVTFDAVARAGFVKWTDGTNTAAVKAASTVAAASDPSGVVQLSPNDTLTTIMAAGTPTISLSITRPADTNVYAINDVYADSTSAPTSGGFTFTSAARASGKTGKITDLWVSNSNNAATTLQGELWLFDSAPTAVNDNAAWALSDADVLKVVAVIPFALIAEANNSWAHIQNLSIGIQPSGSANLRALVKVRNAYTPASAEVLQFRLKISQDS